MKTLKDKPSIKGTGPKKLSKREIHKNQGHSIGINHTYDAYYCITCVEWLENKCIQESCQFCPNRPDKPNI